MVDKPSWKKKFSPSSQKGKHSPTNQLYFDPFSRLCNTFTKGDGYPLVDVSERGETITLLAEIPGIERDKIDVTLTRGRYITIKGEKNLEKHFRDEEFYRAERSFGSFSRTIDLPAEVDEASIEATYKRGVLRIKMKKATPDAQQIRIPSRR